MTIRVYSRVSTKEQNLDRQKQANVEYAQDEFDVQLSDIEFYRDKSTGTDTKRDGYKELMNEVDEGDTVIVKDLSRLARSLQDLQRTINRIHQSGAEIHFVDERMVFSPDEDDAFQNLQMQLLGAFAEFEAKIRQQNTKEGITARQEDEDYHHGPAPLGFNKDDGRLIEGENYGRVCAVLDMVSKDNLSKRKAAKELDTTRATIRRAIEKRPELYGL